MLGKTFLVLAFFSVLVFCVHLCDRFHQSVRLQLKLRNIQVLVLLVYDIYAGE